MKKAHSKAGITDKHNINPKPFPKLPLRSERLAQAALRGGFTREQADRIAPASNSPHYVMIIRRRLGIELECEKVNFTTKDGESSWYGKYSPSERDKLVIREYFAAKEVKS